MPSARPSLFVLVLVAALACAACGSFASSAAAPSEAADAGQVGSEAGTVDAAPSGTCSLGMLPSDVATTTGNATKLQTNGESLFWIEDGARLVRASLADCKTTDVAKAGSILALAVDAKWIVWGDPGYHALARDAAVTTAATHPASLTSSLLLAGGASFWLDESGLSTCDTPCTSTTVAAVVESPQLLATNGTRLFVFATDPAAKAAGALFWRDASLAGPGGDLMGPLVDKQDPIALVANDKLVFWVNATGDIHGMPAGGGASITFPAVAAVRALAVDSAFLYIATPGGISRVSVDGGAPTPVVENENEIRSLLVTTDAIVWSTATAVRRMRKK